MPFKFNPFTNRLDEVTTASAIGAVTTLTGDTGGAISPDGSGNINVLGTAAQGISTSGAGSTVTWTIANASTTQKGVVALATNAEAIAGTDTAKALTADDIKAKLGTQTNHSLLVGAGTSSAVTALGAATNGQLPIGSTGADPVLATLTQGTGISISNGAGSITIAAAAGVATTYTEDSGSATPSANNLNVLGSGSITTTGSGATITTALTGLTNHNVLVGAGTATITKVAPSATSGVPLISQGASADPTFGTAVVAGGGTGAVTLTNHGVLVGQGTSAVVATATGSAGQVLQSGGASADPTYSTATYPSTTTVSQILYSSATNTVSGLATANRGVLTTGATGVPAITALATDGQLIIGSTAGAPAAATLTAGTGISITNASNSITIANTSTGLTWTVVTGTTQSMAVNNGYIANNAGLVTATLPATSAVGDIVEITGINNATGWKIAQNAGNQIFFGSSSSTAGTGGFISSTDTRDSVRLVCVTANAAWNVLSSIGNITVS